MSWKTVCYRSMRRADRTKKTNHLPVHAGSDTRIHPTLRARTKALARWGRCSCLHLFSDFPTFVMTNNNTNDFAMILNPVFATFRHFVLPRNPVCATVSAVVSRRSPANKIVPLLSSRTPVARASTSSAMTKPKALLLGSVDQYVLSARSCFGNYLYPSRSAQDTWRSLSSLADLVEPASTNRKDFLQECKDGKLDGVVACYRTFGSVSVTGPWDEELVKALPSSFGMVAHNG